MLPTPNTSHVSYSHIYEPSEDSFLLLDTLSAESDFLRNRFKKGSKSRARQDGSPLVLEIGIGSGVILAFVAMHAEILFGRNDILTMGTDVNLFACSAAEKTVTKGMSSQYRGFLNCAQADLASILKPHSVDVLLLNPPYVPSECLPAVRNELQNQPNGNLEGSHLLSLATDGGDKGMEVTARVLAQLPELLSRPKGVAYVLLCAQNKPEEVKNSLSSWGSDWAIKTVGKSGVKGGWERLQIIRVARVHQDRIENFTNGH